MTLGLAERQGRLGNVAAQRCWAELPERSIYRLLHAERDRLFPDELFADLYVRHGRRSVSYQRMLPPFGWAGEVMPVPWAPRASP